MCSGQKQLCLVATSILGEQPDTLLGKFMMLLPAGKSALAEVSLLKYAQIPPRTP
jgi:hypothetical protein